ncbi:MAG: SAM-dependent methyltransferase [Acidobacteriota bacterium]|nr:SAM-dependent methyltransferase [Acidobacteriota bacterium]
MIETISKASSIAERLREQIRRDGPITFCEWMKAALYDPDGGYYTRAGRSRWGREGDYRTSPERSSLFAATFARYFASLHESLGSPSEWTIAEAGAGDGAFAHGVLRTLQTAFPHVFVATRYFIDEISPDAQSQISRRLQPFADRVDFARIEDAVVDPGLVFSNELLDAFPVHRVTMAEGELAEFYVNVAGDGKFEWTLGSTSTPRLADHFEASEINLLNGQIAEVNLEIGEWLSKVSQALRSGYVVTVDYGAGAQELYDPATRLGGTLRGFKNHRFVEDLLADPGDHDLTTTVNWTYVKQVGEKLGLKVIEFEQLEKFLLGANLLTQLEVELQVRENEVEKLLLSTAARDMILPNSMATHFQVLVQKKSL